MTKFISLEEPKEKKKTILSSILDIDGRGGLKVRDVDVYDSDSVDKFDNVLHIGHNPFYGDVFKCWNDGKSFTLYFGDKGDEF